MSPKWRMKNACLATPWLYHQSNTCIWVCTCLCYDYPLVRISILLYRVVLVPWKLLRVPVLIQIQSNGWCLLRQMIRTRSLILYKKINSCLMHLCKTEILIWELDTYIFRSKEEIGTGILAGGNNDNSSAFLLTSISVAWTCISYEMLRQALKQDCFPICRLMFKSLKSYVLLLSQSLAQRTLILVFAK